MQDVLDVVEPVRPAEPEAARAAMRPVWAEAPPAVPPAPQPAVRPRARRRPRDEEARPAGKPEGRRRAERPQKTEAYDEAATEVVKAAAVTPLVLRSIDLKQAIVWAEILGSPVSMRRSRRRGSGRRQGDQPAH